MENDSNVYIRKLILDQYLTFFFFLKSSKRLICPTPVLDALFNQTYTFQLDPSLSGFRPSTPSSSRPWRIDLDPC